MVVEMEAKLEAKLEAILGAIFGVILCAKIGDILSAKFRVSFGATFPSIICDTKLGPTFGTISSAKVNMHCGVEFHTG